MMLRERLLSTLANDVPFSYALVIFASVLVAFSHYQPIAEIIHRTGLFFA